MTLPAPLKDRVLAAAREAPSPTRSAGRSRARLALGVAIAGALCVFTAAGGFAHGGEDRPAWFEGLVVGAWMVVALWATWGAVRRPGLLGNTRGWLLAVALVTPAALTLFQLQFEWTCPTLTLPIEGHLGLKCFALGLGLGAMLLVALLYGRRGSDPVHPVATGAALGAATGAWAGVFLDLWCPAANASHVLLGHVGPILVLSLLGAGLGVRVLGVRVLGVRVPGVTSRT